MAQKEQKKSGQGPFINPLTDVGFKKIFSRENNKDLLIKFLNAVFRGRKTIVDLTYGKTEHVGDGKDEAGVIFDLFCTGDQGERFILEVQRADQEFFRERSVVYTSRQISSQAPRGKMKEWNYNLQEVYLVALLENFTMPNSVPEHYIHDIRLMDRETKEVFYEKLGYIYIELINFAKTEEELETDLDDWLYSFKVPD